MQPEVTTCRIRILNTKHLFHLTKTSFYNNTNVVAFLHRCKFFPTPRRFTDLSRTAEEA